MGLDCSMLWICSTIFQGFVHEFEIGLDNGEDGIAALLAATAAAAAIPGSANPKEPPFLLLG